MVDPLSTTEAVVAKIFWQMLLIGMILTEFVPAKTSGKVSLTGTMFTEVVEADFE